MSSRAAKRKRLEESRAVVRELFLRFIERLRAVLKRRGPEFYARFPNARRPCRTCAFNPATDSWRGFDQTMWNLVKSLQHGHPFYCHEGLPYTEGEGWTPLPHDQMKLCAGYAVVAGDPETDEAFETAVWGYCAANPLPEGRRRVVDAAARDALKSIVRTATA